MRRRPGCGWSSRIVRRGRAGRRRLPPGRRWPRRRFPRAAVRGRARRRSHRPGRREPRPRMRRDRRAAPPSPKAGGSAWAVRCTRRVLRALSLRTKTFGTDRRTRTPAPIPPPPTHPTRAATARSCILKPRLLRWPRWRHRIRPCNRPPTSTRPRVLVRRRAPLRKALRARAGATPLPRRPGSASQLRSTGRRAVPAASRPKAGRQPGTCRSRQRLKIRSRAHRPPRTLYRSRPRRRRASSSPRTRRPHIRNCRTPSSRSHHRRSPCSRVRRSPIRRSTISRSRSQNSRARQRRVGPFPSTASLPASGRLRLLPHSLGRPRPDRSQLRLPPRPCPRPGRRRRRPRRQRVAHHRPVPPPWRPP